MIRGPAIVGAGARVVDAYIGPYTSIGDGVRVEGAEIETELARADLLPAGRVAAPDERDPRGKLVGDESAAGQGAADVGDGDAEADHTAASHDGRLAGLRHLEVGGRDGDRLAGNGQVSAVLVVEVLGAAVALGVLGFYLSVLGRGLLPMLAAAALVTMLLLVTFDLDRPTRGLITVPATPLELLRASMALPPAAG